MKTTPRQKQLESSLGPGTKRIVEKAYASLARKIDLDNETNLDMKKSNSTAMSHHQVHVLVHARSASLIYLVEDKPLSNWIHKHLGLPGLFIS